MQLNSSYQVNNTRLDSYFTTCVHSSTPTQVFIEMDESSCELFDIVLNSRLDQLKQFSGNRLLLQQNRDGMSLIHAAVISNNLEALQFLLDENIIPINTQDKNKETCLHLSVKSGSTGAMTMLLRKGADNMIKNSDDNTPLHLLLQRDSGCVEQLSEFLKYPVDISVEGENGSSIFHAIVKNDNIEALKLITQLDTAKYLYKNRFGLQNKFGMPAIHFASLRGAHKVLDFMLLKAREFSDSHIEEVLYHLDRRLNTPLHYAVEHGHKGAVDVLLKHRASPTAMKGNKLPPIHLACVQNKMDIAMAMVESFGVEIFLSQDSTGVTPLHCCCSKNVSEELFCFVVNNVSNLNAQDNNGNTPLHASVAHGNAGRVEFLLANGSDPTIQNKNGFNPFHLSIISRRREAFKALAKSQHATNLSLLPDSEGYCPAHLALKHKFGQSIPTLVSLAMDSDSQFDSNILAYNDKDGNSFLHTAAESMDVSSLKYLLSLRCSRYLLNCLNSEGLIPLHFAARSGFVASVRELIDHGAVEQKSYNGDTPFMLACRHGHLETAKLLIEVSLSISKNDVNNDGNSALHLAARSKNVDVILMCLDLGIEITLNDSRESFFDIVLRDAVAETSIAILKHKRYEDCINVYSPDLSHPILRLIETIPKAFQALLDQCMLCSPLQPEHPDYWEEYNFKYLALDCEAPPLTPQGDERPTEKSNSFLTSSCSTNEAEQPRAVQVKKETTYAVLNHLIRYRHRGYLVHPLINTFLNLKWRRYALPFHVFRFMLFLLLMIALSIFILVTPLTAQSETANTTANYSGEVSYGFNDSSIVFRFLTLVLCAVNFIMWLIDLYVKGLDCVKYLLAESSVWMYGITLLFTFIFVIPWRGLDILYWEVGAIAVFLGWFTVAVFLQTFEVVGIFVTMMFKVTRNVIGVLLITIVMIFAFAFPLYILVGTVPDLTFTTIGMSLFSILASLNGEIDYDTFVRLELLEGFPYTLLTLIVVCVLTIIMPIVVTNLLIGLAVGDIASIQKEAILSQRSVEVHALTAIDKLVPKWFFKKYLQQQTYKLYPNKNIWLRFKRTIYNLWSKTDELEDKNTVALTSQDRDSEQSKDNCTKIWKLESTLSKIIVEQSQQREALQRMEEMLRTLIGQKEN